MSRNGNEHPDVPDPEVVPMARRRQFTAEQKLRFLEKAGACTEPREIGAFLRREGTCSLYLNRWPRARDCACLTPRSPQQRGQKVAMNAALAREVTRLQRENARLQARLDQAETIIRVRKQLSRLYGPNPGENESNTKR